jgi:hypothetical protein
MAFQENEKHKSAHANTLLDKISILFNLKSKKKNVEKMDIAGYLNEDKRLVNMLLKVN